MARFPLLLLLTATLISFTACSTPEEQARADRERAVERRRQAQEDREFDERQAELERQERAENAREDARYLAQKRREFMEDYAYDLGKTVSELTRSERADAEREFQYRYGRRD